MKKLLTLLCSLLLVCLFCTSVSANDTKIIDEANVLSESDEAELNALANEYINKTGNDIVIYYAYGHSEYFDSMNEDDAITALADDYYDHGGYGIGQDNNGLIMCVDFGYGTYTITTCGNECINTYTDNALNYMYDNITPYLSDGEYSGAVREFIYLAENIYDSRINESNGGSDNSYYYEESKTSSLEDAVGFSLVIAVVVTLISFFVFYKQLKNTAVKTEANRYVKSSNLNIFRSGEIYLYTTRSRVKIERPKSNGGGGSTIHMSSSGVSHGGGGSHRF